MIKLAVGVLRTPGVRLALAVLLALLATSAVLAQDTTPTPRRPVTIYIVAPGDSLASIARLYDISLQELMEANSITDPNLIFVGQRLRVPRPLRPTPVESPTPTFTATFTASPSATPTATATTPPTATPTTAPSATPTLPPTTEPTATPTLPPTTAATATPRVVSGLPFDVGGLVFGFNQADFMTSAGMTWVSIALRWQDGDSANTARRAIEIGHGRGFSVLLRISGDPQEMQADPVGYDARFAAYLGEVAAFAPDAIQVWDSMNSPEAWASGSIDASAYAQMLGTAYQAIKTANPATLVISGGLAQSNMLGGAGCGAGCDDLTYLQGMAEAGVGQAADCIGINYTLGATEPTAISGDPRGADFLYYYPAVISVYAGVFPNKPLCLTDLGYLAPTGEAPTGYEWAANTSLAEQAVWLAQTVELARDTGRIRLLIVDNVDATGSSPASDYAIVRDGKCVACDALRVVN